MIVKDNIKIPIKDINDYYIVSDFDRTITSGESVNSWCILEENEKVSQEYKKEMLLLQDYYRGIEMNPRIDDKIKTKHMEDWWNKHLELFIKYKFNEELFNKTASSKNIMELRKGIKEFIYYLNKNNIPLVIISAGLTNVIKAFLKEHEILLDNVYVISNEIYFKDGIAKGINHNIIHSMNKNEVSLPKELEEKLSTRNNVLLFGDNLSDVQMVDKNKHNNVITIGFVNNESKDYKEEYVKTYDIIFEEDEDFNTVLNNIL